LLAQHRAGSLAVQAFAVEWGAGRLGVAWSDPEAPPPTTPQVLRRLAKGALLGLGAAALVLGFAGLTGAVRLSRWTFSGPELLVGIGVAVFAAVRDELLQRGLVLRAFRHTLGPASKGLLAVCAAVAAAARLGQAPSDDVRGLLTTPSGLMTLVFAALGGVCLATLWFRDRGAWMACGARATWTLSTTTIISGGLCDARWSPSVWGGAGGAPSAGAAAAGVDGSLQGSVAAGLALLVVAAGAAYTWYRPVAGKG
jgi:hypothetical protein